LAWLWELSFSCCYDRN